MPVPWIDFKQTVLAIRVAEDADWMHGIQIGYSGRKKFVTVFSSNAVSGEK